MAAFKETKFPANAPIAEKAVGWIDDRFPLTKLWEDQWGKYYAPKNFNFWYIFGILATLILVLQIVTGIFLTMHYKPDAGLAFGSVEYIMREVPWGWLVRYMHSTGASAFFIVVYLHMTRGLLYGSYRKPRELIWLFGFAIFLALMAEAFFGYLLPWGQMSYWGAQVIVNLFGAIPLIGPDLSLWIRGDYVVSDATLNRFFAFHVIAIPLVILGLVAAHLIALHEVGSNNPDGIEVKDTVGVGVFLIIFSLVIFFAPEMGGYFLEHANFDPANSLQTPEHIAPVWYFTPYYAILRAVPNKLAGVGLMGAAVLVFAFLPWLDRGKVRSIRYRGWLFKTFVALFAISFIALGYLGLKPVTPTYTYAARVFGIIYFLFFLLMPWYTVRDRTKPQPERVVWR